MTTHPLVVLLQQLAFWKTRLFFFFLPNTFTILNPPPAGSPEGQQHMRVGVSKPTGLRLYSQLSSHTVRSRGARYRQRGYKHPEMWEEAADAGADSPGRAAASSWLMPFLLCRVWMVQREKKVTAARRGTTATLDPL